MLSINLEYPDVLKDFNSIFIGAMTKQYVRDSDIIGTSQHALMQTVSRIILFCVPNCSGRRGEGGGRVIKLQIFGKNTLFSFNYYKAMT